MAPPIPQGLNGSAHPPSLMDVLFFFIFLVLKQQETDIDNFLFPPPQFFLK